MSKMDYSIDDIMDLRSKIKEALKYVKIAESIIEADPRVKEKLEEEKAPTWHLDIWHDKRSVRLGHKNVDSMPSTMDRIFLNGIDYVIVSTCSTQPDFTARIRVMEFQVVSEKIDGIVEERKMKKGIIEEFEAKAIPIDGFEDNQVHLTLLFEEGVNVEDVLKGIVEGLKKDERIVKCRYDLESRCINADVMFVENESSE